MNNFTKLTQSMSILLTGLLMATTSAHAVVTAYSADDLLIGFTQTGSTNSYVLNIGQALQYRTASSSIVLNTSAATRNGDGTVTGIGSAASIASDISSIFSNPNWATDGTVQWGIIGTSGSSNVGTDPLRDPARTLYASSTTATPTDTSYFRQTSSNQTGVAANIIAMANSGAESSYAGSLISGVLSPVGLKETSSMTNNFRLWSSTDAGASALSTLGSFSYFSPSIMGTISGGSATLDLFRIQASSLGVTGGQATTVAGQDLGQLLGTFNINSSGTITFTAAVPEPSRALLLLGGLSSLLLRRRRPAATV